MLYQVSKIQLALNTPALYPCQRAISRLARHGDKKLGTPRSIQLSTLYFIPTLITSI